MKTCVLCGKTFKDLTNSHMLTKHQMTLKEYRSIYGNASHETPVQSNVDKFKELESMDNIVDDFPQITIENLKINIDEMLKPTGYKTNNIINDFPKSGIVKPKIEEVTYSKGDNTKSNLLENLKTKFGKMINSKICKLSNEDIEKKFSDTLNSGKRDILSYLYSMFTNVEYNYFIKKLTLNGQLEYNYISDIVVLDLKLNIEFPNSFWHNRDYTVSTPFRDLVLAKDGWYVIRIESRNPTVFDVVKKFTELKLI